MPLSSSQLSNHEDSTRAPEQIEASNYHVVNDKQKEPNTCSQAMSPPSTRRGPVFSDSSRGGGEPGLGDKSSPVFVPPFADMTKTARNMRTAGQLHGSLTEESL